MARTREFDPAQALDKAMKVFWRKGYYAASIEELVEATGVSRYGLYGEYGNKRGLFLAALDHYRDSVAESMASVIHAPGVSLDAIRQFFAFIEQIAEQPSSELGCLMCNTASEVAPHDAGAAQKVNSFREQLTAGFRGALTNALTKGELSSGYDVNREADFLAGVTQALSMLMRSRAEPSAIRNLISVALSTLQ
jgi:TetR/AcrR family transcriptional repressor of nem operon